MEKNARIYVAGSQSPIGTAILRELETQGCPNLMGWNEEGLDLTAPFQVDAYLASTKPEYVFVAAGKSGGIRANQKYPADFMRHNLLIECNLIHGAHKCQIKKLLYLASSCCYPRYCPQPMQEDSLLTGLLEPTNEAYAVAKIAGLKLCQAYRQKYGANFICGIPANAFGPGDDFSQEDSHVIPAIIRRMHEGKKQGAKSVTLWGKWFPAAGVHLFQRFSQRLHFGHAGV